MEPVQEVIRIDKRIFGNGIVYVKAITDENETIKGISFFLFKKQLLTFAFADTLWVDDNNQPYHFKMDGTVLFIKQLAVGFGKRGI